MRSASIPHDLFWEVNQIIKNGVYSHFENHARDANVSWVFLYSHGAPQCPTNKKNGMATRLTLTTTVNGRKWQISGGYIPNDGFARSEYEIDVAKDLETGETLEGDNIPIDQMDLADSDWEELHKLHSDTLPDIDDETQKVIPPKSVPDAR